MTAHQLMECFVALVAPSFTGKTQSAFVINTVKPLYFCVDDGDYEQMQSIYLNFISHTRCLKMCAYKDFMELKNLALPSEKDLFEATYLPNIYGPVYQLLDQLISYMSVSNLISKYSDLPSFALGFIMALIERSDKEFASSGMDGIPCETKKFPFLGEINKRVQTVPWKKKRLLCLFG